MGKHEGKGSGLARMGGRLPSTQEAQGTSGRGKQRALGQFLTLGSSALWELDTEARPKPTEGKLAKARMGEPLPSPTWLLL